ncbi:MAG: hypothetical protein RL499_1144 [Actinomycetota bacterium]
MVAAHNRGMTQSADSSFGRFLTVTDVAELLNLSAGEVTSLIRAGELPGIHLGAIGQWRIEQSVLESFVADKYDEHRRIARWHEAQTADVAELFGERRTRPRRA